MSTLNSNCTRSVLFVRLELHYMNVKPFWIKWTFIAWLDMLLKFLFAVHYGSMLAFFICFEFMSRFSHFADLISHCFHVDMSQTFNSIFLLLTGRARACYGPCGHRSAIVVSAEESDIFVLTGVWQTFGGANKRRYCLSRFSWIGSSWGSY